MFPPRFPGSSRGPFPFPPPFRGHGMTAMRHGAPIPGPMSHHHLPMGTRHPLRRFHRHYTPATCPLRRFSANPYFDFVPFYGRGRFPPAHPHHPHEGRFGGCIPPPPPPPPGFFHHHHDLAFGSCSSPDPHPSPCGRCPPPRPPHPHHHPHPHPPPPPPPQQDSPVEPNPPRQQCERRPEPIDDERQSQENDQDCQGNSSDLWTSVGPNSWTSEVQIGPFSAEEIRVTTQGHLGVGIAAAHHHGDVLVASFKHLLPAPPFEGSFTVSHAVSLHDSVIITAIADFSQDMHAEGKDSSETDADPDGDKNEDELNADQDEILESISEIEIG